MLVILSGSMPGITDCQEILILTSVNIATEYQ